MEMSPSLRLTLDPPSALSRAEVGRLMNENTERPALETCAKAGVQSTAYRIQIIMTIFLRTNGHNLSKSAAKVRKKNELCKKM